MKATAADGAARFVRDRGPDSLAHDPAVYRVPIAPAAVRSAPLRDWSSDAAEFEAEARGRLPDLAADLGVPLEALEALGAGWTGQAWSFPSRDGHGQVIGIATRLPDGRKLAVKTSRMGLFYAPDHWAQGQGPVFIVEGPSDTAALTGLGLAAVGRASNAAGGAVLAILLREWPEDRGIVVVGERDEKPDGSWPGRDGAVRVAEFLAAALYRDVSWTLPPEGIKDSREYAKHATGPEIEDAYLTAATIVPGKPRPPHEVATVPSEPPRDLDAYRAELLAAKRLAVETVGIQLDRSPTGAGKTFSLIEALRGVGKTKTVQALPTHTNVRERAAEMIAGGHAATRVGVVPQLAEANCQMFEAAEAARAAGLSHGQAVCRQCLHRKGCEYLRLKAQAERRQHLITTAEHFTRSHRSKRMQERDVVIVDEKPDLTLAPRVFCREADLEDVIVFLDRIVAESNAEALRSLEDWAADPGPRADTAVEVGSTAEALRTAAEAILGALRTITAPGAIEHEIEVGRLPSDWQHRLSRTMASRGLAAPPEAAMRLLHAAADEGGKVWLLADWTDWTDWTKSGSLDRTALVTWRTDLTGKRVILLDGTADPEALARLAGGAEVADVTPTGHLGLQHPIVQRVVRVHKGNGLQRVRDIIETVIEEGGWQRVGLIGLKPHIEAVMAPDGPESLAPHIRDRIAKVAYSGEGPDRASNEWHAVCDVLLVIGTPHPNRTGVRQALAVEGNTSAAKLSDGSWCDGSWVASTIEGGTETLVSRGYAEPAWRAAHQGITRANLLQAVGRARAGLPDGIPAVVISDEPLGLPVDTRALVVRSRTARRVLAAMRAVETAYFAGETSIPAPENGTSEDCARNGGDFPIRIRGPEETPIGKYPLFHAQRFSLVVAASGVDRRDTSHALDSLARTGDVHQPERGYWALGPAPTEPVTYTRLADTEIGSSGLGRPPEKAARLTETRAALDALARDGNSAVTVPEFAAAAADLARRTAEKNLAEAVSAAAAVKVHRGLYAPALPATRVTGGYRTAAWARDEWGTPPRDRLARIEIETREPVARADAVVRAGGVHITLIGPDGREVSPDSITSIKGFGQRPQ